MSDKIKLLPESVANQIAAGEVVNRPSSAVKEMMENAIDAGATEITVNFRDGGKALLQVVDNGCGMSANDARLAFDRHATSKIERVDDIYSLGTFGFRGEALASIASVAEVELRTRQHGAELGTSVCISGGRFVSQEPVSCPEGSQFAVRNLFYNVPARRRFLEKSSTESKHIIAEFQRVALCNPDVGFTLYDSDTQQLSLQPGTLRQRIVGIFGRHTGKNLLEARAETSIVKIEGFVGRPASARQSNKEQFLFVNGRYFRNGYFQKAILAAYDKLIPSNTQPSYFLYLTIDPSRIDVNVHPQKTEVKFEDGTEIWSIINAAVREALARSGAVPAMDFDMDESVEIPVFRERTDYRIPRIEANPDFNPFEKYDDSAELGRVDVRDVISRVDPDFSRLTEESIPDSREYERSVLDFVSDEGGVQGKLDVGHCAAETKVLPIDGRYAAAVHEEVLLLVDLPRAYETVLYERYSIMLGNESSVSQQLLFPERLTMSADDAGLLRDHTDDFAAFGFDLLFEDEFTVLIKGVPSELSEVSAEQSVYDMIDSIKDINFDSDRHRREKMAAMMARIASASRKGFTSATEAGSLVVELLSGGNPSFTPSGKAVLTVLNDEDIKKLLG